MAKEILVNDGGAPARIYPFVAGSTITAGDVLMMGTDGEVDPSNNVVEPALGVALTDAATGETVNCISGRGVIVRVKQRTNLNAAGTLCMIDTGNIGEVIAHTGTAVATKFPICMTLEAINSTEALVKVMLH
jgi:predicted RecA/RadA family phage recombinase